MPGSVGQGGIAVNSGLAPSVVLIGDSEATTYGSELAAMARADRFRLNILAASGENELPQEAGTWWPQIVQTLGPRRYDVVVVSSAWAMKPGGNSASHLAAALPFLLQHARHVVVIGQIPEAPAGVTRLSIAAGRAPPYFESPVSRAKRTRFNAQLAALTSPRVTLIDASDMLVGGDGAMRMTAANGRLAWYDQYHLSSSGAELLRPRLEAAIQRGLGR